MGKMDEKVLCVRTELLESDEDFEIIVDKHYEFRKRGDPKKIDGGCETDPEYKQIIPYFIFVQNGKVLAYQKSTSSGESRLHGLISIGIGGHVNESDGKGMSAVRRAAIRECLEEIGVSPELTAFNRKNEDFILIDISGNAADYHIGYCQIIKGWTPKELQMSREVEGIDWLTLDELKEKTLEEWTEYLIPLLEEDWGDLFEPDNSKKEPWSEG